MTSATRLRLALLLFVSACPITSVASESQTGFLVVAPDRGFLGNQEIQAVFEDFKQSYAPAALAHVGRGDNGMGSEYSIYAGRALGELTRAGVSEIIAIPLFLSKSDPVLEKVMMALPAYPGARPIRWAAPMADSYLIKQIVWERAAAISRDPEQERLLLVGFGATDEASEKGIANDLDRLLAYIVQRTRFKDARALLYYDRGAPDAEGRNKEIDRLIMESAAKKGRTLLVPATIGPKFDHTMAWTTWLGNKFSDLDVVYGGEEILPHFNVLLWLKKPPTRIALPRLARSAS